MVVVGVLYMLLHFIIFVIFIIIIIIIINIIIIIITVNIIFIIFIISSIFIKSSLLLLWGKLTVQFCFFYFRHVLTWSTWPPFGVDALPWYYHLASFNYDDMKAGDIGRIADVIWAW